MATPAADRAVLGTNVAATMLVHGIDTIVTRNVSDYRRFRDHIRGVDLLP